MPTTLIAADGHPIFLLGLKHLLDSQSDLRLLTCCSRAAKVLDALGEHQPDVLLFALNLPDRDGLQLIRDIRAAGLSTARPILLTERLDDEQTIEALRLDIQGVVLKSMPIHLLIQCIHKVASGGQWLEKDSIGHAFEKMLHREAGARRLATILTDRETEVMGLVARGLSNRQIAEKLILSEGTVKIHIHNIYSKLGINNRVDLTLYAQKKGII
ncbi:MAG: response regulator transcription factor [Desulfuromonadales bacterium]|nr:response regulator transcription factor [Desulfuromonadales bacterium]